MNEMENFVEQPTKKLTYKVEDFEMGRKWVENGR